MSDWTCPTCGEYVVDFMGMIEHVDEDLDCPEKTREASP